MTAHEITQTILDVFMVRVKREREEEISQITKFYKKIQHFRIYMGKRPGALYVTYPPSKFVRLQIF